MFQQMYFSYLFQEIIINSPASALALSLSASLPINPSLSQTLLNVFAAIHTIYISSLLSSNLAIAFSYFLFPFPFIGNIFTLMEAGVLGDDNVTISHLPSLLS